MRIGARMALRTARLPKLTCGSFARVLSQVARLERESPIVCGAPPLLLFTPVAGPQDRAGGAVSHPVIRQPTPCLRLTVEVDLGPCGTLVASFGPEATVVEAVDRNLAVELEATLNGRPRRRVRGGGSSRER